MNVCYNYEEFKKFQNNLLNHFIESDLDNKNENISLFIKEYSKEIRHCYCNTICPYSKECELKEKL